LAESTPTTPAEQQRHEVNAIVLSLAVGLALLLIKFVAYFLTHSAAIFSDAMENIVNVMAAVFALYAIRLAHRPADNEHPYGHGKIEFFSGGLEGGMIILAAILIVGKVIISLFNHEPPAAGNLDTGVKLIGFAMVVNGVVGFALLRLGRRRNSLTLEADGQHLISDAITSVMVLVALLAVKITGKHWIDPLAAIAVAMYITLTGVKLVKRSAAGLMDEQDKSDQKLLKQILDSHIGPNGKPPLVCSYHKVRQRHSGRYHWVDFHLVVPAWWDIDQGHRVASSIEYEIELALREGNATAHIEPCTTPNCPNCAVNQAPPADVK
jgi:cation diffusion facilitator family transporter